MFSPLIIAYHVVIEQRGECKLENVDLYPVRARATHYKNRCKRLKNIAPYFIAHEAHSKRARHHKGFYIALLLSMRKALFTLIRKHIMHMTCFDAVFVAVPKSNVQQVCMMLHKYTAHVIIA